MMRVAPTQEEMISELLDRMPAPRPIEERQFAPAASLTSSGELTRDQCLAFLKAATETLSSESTLAQLGDKAYTLADAAEGGWSMNLMQARPRACPRRAAHRAKADGGGAARVAFAPSRGIHTLAPCSQMEAGKLCLQYQLEFMEQSGIERYWGCAQMHPPHLLARFAKPGSTDADTEVQAALQAFIGTCNSAPQEAVCMWHVACACACGSAPQEAVPPCPPRPPAVPPLPEHPTAPLGRRPRPSYPPTLLPSYPPTLPPFHRPFVLPSYRPKLLPTLLPSYPPTLLPSYPPALPPFYRSHGHSQVQLRLQRPDPDPSKRRYAPAPTLVGGGEISPAKLIELLHAVRECAESDETLRGLTEVAAKAVEAKMDPKFLAWTELQKWQREVFEMKGVEHGSTCMCMAVWRARSGWPCAQ